MCALSLSACAIKALLTAMDSIGADSAGVGADKLWKTSTENLAGRWHPLVLNLWFTDIPSKWRHS